MGNNLTDVFPPEASLMFEVYAGIVVLVCVTAGLVAVTEVATFVAWVIGFVAGALVSLVLYKTRPDGE